MPERNEQIVLIRRSEEDHGKAHHGGAWKVAYADFMTAMMAFFLILWILAASDDEKLRGLADYFTPSLSESGGRGQGVLEGSVLGPKGVKSGSEGERSETQLPSFGQENPLAVFDSRLRDQNPQVIVEHETRPAGEITDTTAGRGEGEPGNGTGVETAAEGTAAGTEGTGPGDTLDQLEAEMRAAEALADAVAERSAVMAELEEAITGRIAGDAQLQDYAENLQFDRTGEGLDIQILDKEGRSMFTTGSARVGDRTRELIAIIAEAVADLPNPLVITGHTDSTPYRRAESYSNWELSVDRANATRRVLVESGVNPARITRISGLADTMPLNPDDPGAAENRRISLTLRYPEPEIAPLLQPETPLRAGSVPGSSGPAAPSDTPD